MSRTAVIAGGSGGIGSSLVEHLQHQGFEVTLLSRNPSTGSIKTVVWDARSHGDWAKVLEGADLVINLCGAPINKLWTPERVKLLYSSRIDPTRAIGEAIAKAQDPPKVWVNATATGIYGPTGDAPAAESTKPGTGTAADLAVAWSQALWEHDLPHTKRIEARFAVVLGPHGALPKLVTLTKAFLGAPAGTGKQHMPWIHIQDLCRLVEFAADSIPSGIVNFVAPDHVTNARLMHALADKLGRPHLPPVPAPIVKIGARLTGNQPDLILQGRPVSPVIALAQGFEFRFPTLESALNDLVVT